MSNYTIHKRIEYTDRNFKVESLGEEYKPWCNCQQHFCVNHKDVDVANKEIHSITYDFTIDLGNNLTVSFTQNFDKFKFVKFYHDQPLSGNHFVNKSLEQKVLHQLDLSNRNIHLSYHDVTYRYGSISFNIIKGRLDEMEFETILYPDGIDDNTLLIIPPYVSTSSWSSESESYKSIRDLTGSVIIESELTMRLLDISDILRAQLSLETDMLNNITLDEIKEEIDRVLKDEYVKSLILEIDEVLSKNPLEMDGLIDAKNKVTSTSLSYNNTDKKYISDGCRQLIDDQYAHYRTGTKTSKCLNVMKFYDYRRTFEESVDNFKEIKEPNGPGSIKSFTIKPIDNREQYLKYLVYHNFELKHFNMLDKLISYVKSEHEKNPALINLSEEMYFEGISGEKMNIESI